MIEVTFIVAVHAFKVGDSKMLPKATAVELLRGGYISDPFEKPAAKRTKKESQPAAKRETKEG